MFYWFSHSSHSDDSARYAFHAIRFVVVCKPSTFLDRLRITRSTNTEGFLENATKYPFRSRLRIARDISQATGPKAYHPICNIIFEAVHVRRECITLVPYTVQATTETHLVLFEQLSLIDSTNSALNILLNCTFSYRIVGGIPVHSIRVLPAAGRHDAHSWASLHPKLVLRIVDLVVRLKPDGWRHMLLNYSLVCKSWSHVLSLFFTLMDDTEPLDARHIARALDAKPHYGALIPELYDCYLNFSDFDNSVWWDAFLKILQLATSVKKMFMPLVPLSLADVVVHHLSALRNIQTFRMSHTFYGDHEINVSETSENIAMSTIQYIMSNWEKLSHLDLRGWADKDVYQTAPGAGSCSFQLVRLTLASGTITGSQLLYFVPPTPPTLSKLVLLKIKGPTNADFTVFLDSVAHSLEELQLQECWFEKASSSEELALDATMSKMNLKTASVHKNHISILTLLRKNDMGLRRGPVLFVRSDRYEPGGSDDQSGIIDNIVTFFLERNRTGWQVVSVSCYMAELTHPQSLVDTSIAAAEVNGTALSFHKSSNFDW